MLGTDVSSKDLSWWVEIQNCGHLSPAYVSGEHENFVESRSLVVYWYLLRICTEWHVFPYILSVKVLRSITCRKLVS